MFIRFARNGDVPNKHQELFEYFKVHYKNSNKGIKGRGKARTVAPKSKADGQAHSIAFPHLPMPSHQPTYMPGPPNSMASIPRHHSAGGYGMFDQQPDHSGAAGMLYDVEHSRQIAFTERLY